jgi:hypothetical protein
MGDLFQKNCCEKYLEKDEMLQNTFLEDMGLLIVKKNLPI